MREDWVNPGYINNLTLTNGRSPIGAGSTKVGQEAAHCPADMYSFLPRGSDSLPSLHLIAQPYSNPWTGMAGIENVHECVDTTYIECTGLQPRAIALSAAHPRARFVWDLSRLLFITLK